MLKGASAAGAALMCGRFGALELNDGLLSVKNSALNAGMCIDFCPALPSALTDVFRIRMWQLSLTKRNG